MINPDYQVIVVGTVPRGAIFGKGGVDLLDTWQQAHIGKNTTLWPGFTFDFRHKTAQFDAQNYQTSK